MQNAYISKVHLPDNNCLIMTASTRCFIFLCLYHLCLVEGLGKVALTLFEYDNPSGRDEQGCCDTVLSDCFTDPCDPYFELCLTQHGSSSNCQLGRARSGVVMNSLHEVFTGHVGGGSNPLVVHFDGYQDVLDIDVRVVDKDHGGFEGVDDLMDVIHLEYVTGATPFNAENIPSSHTITGSRTTLRFNVSIQCLDNYYDAGCNTLCISHDDSSGHYTCNQNGTKLCKISWRGVDCDITGNCSGNLVANVCQESTVVTNSTNKTTISSTMPETTFLSTPTSTTSATIITTTISTAVTRPAVTPTTVTTTVVTPIAVKSKSVISTAVTLTVVTPTVVTSTAVTSTAVTSTAVTSTAVTSTAVTSTAVTDVTLSTVTASADVKVSGSLKMKAFHLKKKIAKKTDKTPLMAGVTAGFLATILIIGIALLVRRKKRSKVKPYDVEMKRQPDEISKEAINVKRESIGTKLIKVKAKRKVKAEIHIQRPRWVI